MFCGDVHLGRRPSGLPLDLKEQSGLSARDLGPKAALERAVAEACRERVDAFVFAGDVVQQENSVFEAFGALSRCIEPLARAAIRIFGVAGNHDVETLPRLASSFPQFQLLGAKGRWEDCVLQGRSGPRIVLRGWSFPTQHVSESPFSYPRPDAPEDVCAVLGVVHGDLDDARSRYAPLRRRDLEADSIVKGWFLGHIHKPSLDASAQRPIGYLGSLSALDRTETGRHGPWIVAVENSGALSIEQRALAPLAFEDVSFDVSDWTDGAAFEQALRAKYAAVREARASGANSARAVGFNVSLYGATPAFKALRAKLAEFDEGRLLSAEFDGLLCFVADIDDRTHEPVDLMRLALSTDPAGLLARRLLALQDESSLLAQELIGRALESIEASAPRREFLGALGPPLWSDTQVRSRLLRAGWRALEKLEATREGRPA